MLRLLAVFAVLGQTAFADVVPLRQLPLREEPADTCNFGFGMWSALAAKLVPHGNRAELHALDTQGEPVDACAIGLAAVARSQKLVVYAARVKDIVVIAMPSDEEPAPAQWLAIDDKATNFEKLHQVGDPVQVSGRLHGDIYVVTASISQTWRDKEPLLAITVRWRSATVAK